MDEELRRTLLLKRVEEEQNRVTEQNGAKPSTDPSILDGIDGIELAFMEEPLHVDIIRAPDGGWGWVVVFGAFIVGMLVDGCAFTFGIIMIDMADYYQVSQMEISWAGSVMNGVYLTIGPLVGGLCNKFGCRPIALIGSVIASAGFLMCIYSPNVQVLIVTYGLIGGFGFGMLYLPSIVMVGFYFEKKRAFATGMAVCGSGMGAFVMAPVVELLLEVYEWRSAQMILAAIILNGMAAALVFRPLKFAQGENEWPSEYDSSANDGVSENQLSIISESGDVSPRIERENTSLSVMENTPKRERAVSISVTVIPADPAQNRYVTSLNQIYQPKPVVKRRRAQTEGPGSSDVPPAGAIKYVHSCDEVMFWPGLRALRSQPQIPALVDKDKLKRDLMRPIYRKDIFYAGSVVSLPQYNAQNPSDYHRSVTVIPDQQLENIVEEDDMDGKAEVQKRSGYFSLFGDRLQALTIALLTMLDVSILKSFAFLLYGTSCFLTMLGFFVPFMFLPANAISKGVSRNNAALMLSVIGAANTIGRIACGWVSDRPWANSLIINNSALVLGGLATLCVPFFGGDIYLLYIYCVIFGLSIAVFVSLRSIIMVELIGLDKLTSAFGMVTLFQGLSSFVGAPLAGGIYDATGDYSISFYFAGSMILLAGLVCIPCRRVAAFEQCKLQDKKH